MMSNKESLTVSILGRSYSLRTDEDRQIVEGAAQLVESLLNRFAAAGTSPTEMVKKSTFVALTIAVDLLKERKALEDVGSKTATLNGLLKDSLA